VGARGPSKTPIALATAAGNRAAERRVARPSDQEVRRPQLSPDAGAVWDRLAPDLEAKGLLTFWDVDAFTAYCDAVAQRDRAQEALDRDGEVVDEPRFSLKTGEVVGYVRKKNPWHLVWVDANALMLRHQQRFGLTPADRASVQVPEGDPGTGRSPDRLLSS